MNLNDSLFTALADPTRRAIIARLALGEADVQELARPFAISQPAISRHLRVLEDAGLIETRIRGTRRPRRLAPQGLNQLDRWLALLRESMETNYARLDALLAEDEPGKDML